MIIRDRISRILEHSGGEWSVDDICQLVKDKRIFLMEYEGTLIMFEVQTYPQKRILHIWGTEGKGTLEQMSALVKWAKDIARQLDCSELRCQGRKGWERALSKHGTRVLYTTLVMEL